MSPRRFIGIADWKILGYIGLDQELINFSLKSQIENVLGFASHTVSAAATQHCSCNAEAAIDNSYRNECDYVSVKVNLQIFAVSWIWHEICDFPTPGLEQWYLIFTL